MLLVICHQKEDWVDGGFFFNAFISPISKMLMTRLLVCFYFFFSFLSLDLIKNIGLKNI